MSVYITYFVHGTTIDNQNHIASGWLPGELSEKGIGQTFALKENIDTSKFDVVFCSDLKRAIDSANNVFGDMHSIITDSRLRECNYGVLNGKDNSLVVYKEHIEEPFEEGESMLDVEKRMNEFCLFLLENYNNKKVAIVAHKAPQLALDVRTKGILWEEAIENDWRKTKAWRPGWEYVID